MLSSSELEMTLQVVCEFHKFLSPPVWDLGGGHMGDPIPLHGHLDVALTVLKGTKNWTLSINQLTTITFSVPWVILFTKTHETTFFNGCIF